MTSNRPRSVPRDGLDNPVFEGMGPAEDLIVSMSFLPGLTDSQLRQAYRWVRALGNSPARGDTGVSPFKTSEPFVHEHLFHARIGNLRNPRGAVNALISELNGSGAQIRDSFFACWERGPNRVMVPRRDPRAPEGVRVAPETQEFFERLWDPDLDPPASEVAEELMGGILAMEELVLEHRGAPLHFPEARIAYGLVPFERVDATGPGEPDQPEAVAASSAADAADAARTEEVRIALIKAIDAGWATLFKAPGKSAARPQPLSSDGSADRIDPIVARGRSGYHFCVESVTLLDRPSPASCRFREYELMEAVLGAIEEVGLAPVITWQRFGTPLLVPPVKRPDTVEIQLWEPA